MSTNRINQCHANLSPHCERNNGCNFGLPVLFLQPLQDLLLYVIQPASLDQALPAQAFEEVCALAELRKQGQGMLCLKDLHCFASFP